MSYVETWVSQEFENLAQVINDYDQNLFLEMVPVAAQKDLIDKTKVFRIVDDRTKTIVMYADSLANPTDILARLWSMDQTHNKVVANLDARNAAQQALDLRKQMDQRAELRDFAEFVFANEKNKWRHNGQNYDAEFRSLGSGKQIIT